jgi:prophage antirepressor-like protein
MSIEDMAQSAQDPKNLPVEFEFDSTLVRTIAKDGQAWFVAKDVCEILGIADTSDAVSRLDDDERSTAHISSTANNGATPISREMLTVNESGLYALIFTSRKPEAKRFRKWVTSEVLPAIRQTGRYGSYSDKDPDPVIVWSKHLGVRPSDIIAYGFDTAYLNAGPINPSDYLAHNHRVLCYTVTGLASCWEGLHAQDFDPRWSRREWSARRFARQLQIADLLAKQFLETDKVKAVSE